MNHQGQTNTVIKVNYAKKIQLLPVLNGWSFLFTYIGIINPRNIAMPRTVVFLDDDSDTT